VSTAAGTSGPDSASRRTRDPLAFQTITVVGGGCYGSYYVRQLARAHRAGAATWSELVVVDHDPACRAVSLADEERVPGLRCVIRTWASYFDDMLSGAADTGRDVAGDAIVPSPLMPHLMAEWIVARARRRWPHRRVAVEPLLSPPDVPWQRAGEDGTHYVSFATWMCPINCIEPARCPETRGPRDWSLPPALARYAEREREAGRPVEHPLVFHCSHRTYGVGMIDVGDVIAADVAVERGARARPAAFLLGTASHCHGAVQRLVID